MTTIPTRAKYPAGDVTGHPDVLGYTDQKADANQRDRLECGEYTRWVRQRGNAGDVPPHLITTRRTTMFSLKNAKAKLVNLNLRAELHGDKHVLATDLTIEATVSNDVLSEFHPSLKSALYEKADDAQGELLDEPGRLTALKFSNLGQPLKWNAELKGYQTTVHYGIGGDSDINMIECEVDSFKFECKDGGSVGVKFRVIAHPTEEQVGKLSGLIQSDIELTLLPPEEQQELKEAA